MQAPSTQVMRRYVQHHDTEPVRLLTRTPYSLGSSNCSGSAWRWPMGGGRRGRFPFARSLTSLALGRCRGGLAEPPSADGARDVMLCLPLGAAAEAVRLCACCHYVIVTPLRWLVWYRVEPGVLLRWQAIAELDALCSS